MKLAFDLVAEQHPVRQIGQRIVMGEVRDSFIGEPPLGDVVDDVDDVTRLAGGIADPEPFRGDVARAHPLGLPDVLVLEQAVRRLQRLVFVGDDGLGGGLRKDIVGRLADDEVARNAELGFRHAIDQQVATLTHVLHGNLRRDVIDDLAQESVIPVALLFEVAAFGDVLHRGDPAAVRQRPADGQEGATVRALHDAVSDLAARDVAHHQRAERIDVAIERPVVPAVLHQIAEMAARLHDIGRQIVHVDIAAVEGDDARRGIERDQALNHAVQRSVEPGPFRFQPLLRFAVLAGYLPDDQEQDQGDHGRRQRRRDDEESGLFAPVGQCGIDGVGRDYDARVMRERGGRSQPVRLVNRAMHAQRLLLALFADPLQQWRRRKILSDQFVDAWIPRQHGAVGVKHRDRGAGPERDGRKEFLVVDGINAARHHAEEDAVLTAQPVGNDGVHVAGNIAANRLGQHCRRSRIELERLEVLPVGDVEGRRRQRPRPVDHVSIGIEDGDIAEIGENAGLGSQDLVAFRACDPFPELFFRGESGNLQAGDHVRGDGVGILELLVEMTGEQQGGILQLTLAVDQRAFAEFAGHHDGADEDRRNQQTAAKRQPQHWSPDRRGKMPSGSRHSGLHALRIVKQFAHFPSPRGHAYDGQMP